MPTAAGGQVLRGRARLGWAWAARVGSALAVASALAGAGPLGGCSSDETRTIRLVRVAPAADPGCGLPDDGEIVIVRALGDFPASDSTAQSVELQVGAALDVSSFPDDTEAITVEVVGAGGAVRAAGKSLPLRLGELDAEAEVAVFMAPPLGACPTGPPAVARNQPLAALSGDGALIVGGTDANGQPVHLVERYDPARGQFEVISERLYGTDDLGLLGASATGMADGRVVIAGGPASAYQVYDPASGFSAPFFLNPARAYHAAVALDPSRVLLAAGCGTLLGSGACASGTGLRSTAIIDLNAGTVSVGPLLSQARLGAVAVREGPDSVLLIGGVDVGGDPVTEAERIFLAPDGAGGDGSVTRLEGAVAVGGAGALLPSGTVLTAFAPPAAVAADRAALIPGGAFAPVSAGVVAPARAGATVTALEDGSALILGGADSLVGLRYEPLRARLVEFALPMNLGATPILAPPVPAHAALRLPDGSVLVVGGRAVAADPEADGAWIIRPSLTGPLADSATAVFSDLDLATLAIPRDPGQGGLDSDPEDADGTAHYRLRSSIGTGLPSEWLIVAGARFEQATIEALVQAQNGAGAAVLLGFRSASEQVILLLAPRQEARLLEFSGQQVAAIEPCQGELVNADELAADDAGASARIEVALSPTRITARIRGRLVLSCTGFAPLTPGHVGLGVIGSRDVSLRIDTLSARRLAP